MSVGAYRVQKRSSDLLELKLQVTVAAWHR